MNTKLITSTLAGGIVYFILGFVIYGLLFGDTFIAPEGISKDPMEMWAMGVSCLVWALLIAVVCQRWANARNFKDGAIVGAIIGALVSLSVNIGMYSMYTFTTLNIVILDIFLAGITSAVTGGIIGLILGRGES